MGAVVAAAVIALWSATLAFALERGAASLSWPALVGIVAVRTYLTTGLFITAHDAMHRSVSRHRALNDAVGRLATFLFAAFSYRRLVANHGLHHAHPATGDDPDYFRANGAFVPWFVSFFVRYASWPQVLTMAAIYNLLRLRYDDATLWAFWAGPALLAALQLFTFGTYLPHRPPHDARGAGGPHRTRTLAKHHALAMLTCWFFGYHREHHERPGTPWWRLWTLKDARSAA